MTILDGMKSKWDTIQSKIDQQRRERDAKTAHTIHHEKVPLNEEKAEPRAQSPAERVAPKVVEQAKKAEQQRQQPPPLLPPKEVKPSELKHSMNPQPPPNINAPGSGTIFTVTPQRPAPPPQAPAPSTSHGVDPRQIGTLKKPEARPHEKMAETLDKGPADAMQRAVQARTDAAKKLGQENSRDQSLENARKRTMKL